MPLSSRLDPTNPLLQLKNYEQAVIEKRFSELEEEEVDALLDEVNEQ